MPTDLQTIDGIERLRGLYLDASGGALPGAEAAPADGVSPAARVLEAWLQAQAGRPAAVGAPLRRVRALARALLANGQAALPIGSLTPDEERLLAHGPRLRAGLESATRAGLAPLAERVGGLAPAAEVEAWRSHLPGLAGLRGWRLLERLGRPIIVPEPALRRFLWRFGLFEQDPRDARHLPQAQAIAEQMARLAGIEPASLAALLRWLTGTAPQPAGGGWCVARPRCSECPLRAGCTLARFQPSPTLPADSLRRRAELDDVRERLARDGGERLDDVELLAALLGAGGGLELAAALLERFGNLPSLERASLVELTAVRGLTRARALQLKAALELGRRFAMTALAPGEQIRCADDIWQAYRGRFRNLPQEHFVIVLLDSKNRIMRDQIVSKGTLTGSLAHPREVFQQAIRHAASAIILMHNHPSGDPQPSPEDKEVTRRLREAGELLGIRVLDHIILGADDFFSFRDEGI